MTAKWQLNRAGLLNFWYYDDEVFDFEKGKLLLRGTNGSGKSVTMQSFLPVLLDGKKSPDRLDPFGSKSRRMTDYLLGEKEISNRDERTGYLFIEYKKEGTDQFITTGMGMQAKRNQPLKSWGFVITDNRRVGFDIELFKWVNQEGEKVKFPRSQTELETVIGAGGEVVSTNKEYMALVNRYIFGFETLEAYDDLIKLLIQLRSPKLSKEFRPTVIYEILEGALPALTDEDLRYLSDSIEQMDQTKQQMEQLDREVAALTKLKSFYEQYNDRIFVDQVNDWKHAKKRRLKEEKEVKELKQSLEQLASEIDALTHSREKLKNLQQALEDKEKRLSSHAVFNLEKDLQERIQLQQELQKGIGNYEDKIDRQKNKESKSKKRLQDLEEMLTEQESKQKEVIEELAYSAEESAFSQHEQNLQDYERKKQHSFIFDLWTKEIQQYTKQLENGLQEMQIRDQTMKKMNDKNREQAEAERNRDLAQDEEGKWRDTLSEDKQKLIHNIHLWTDDNDLFQVTAGTLQKMVHLVDDLYSPIEYEEVKDMFMSFVHAYEDELRKKGSRLEAMQSDAMEKLDQLKAEQQELKAQQDPEPIRHEATREARQLLQEKSKVFAPLYELVEFQSHVSDEVRKRLESALTETGLLDALVSAEEIQLRHDRLLAANPKFMSHTLADYLQPDQAQTTIEIKRVQDILQSIEMDGEALVHFGEDGTYQLASLRGHALPLDEVRFIGKEARKRYRETLIAQLQLQMQVFEERIQWILAEKQVIHEALQHSKQAWSCFPSSADVKTGYNEMKKAQSRVELQREKIDGISQQLQELDQDLQRIKGRLFHLLEGVRLQPTAETYQQALVHSRQYEKSIAVIHLEHERFIHFQQDHKRELEIIQVIQEELDEYRGELNILELKFSRTELAISHINEQLQLAGAEEIRNEIKQVTLALFDVKEELENVSEQLPRQREKLGNTEGKVQERQESHAFWQQMETTWEETLQKEWRRGAIDRSENAIFDIDQVESFSGERTLKERSTLEGQLTTLFHNLQTDLMEQKMRLFTEAPEALKWMETIEREEWIPVIEQWKAKNTRNVIEFDQRGVKISPITLHESVSREWSIQENRLDEMDKKLYEDILLNSVGQKLRVRIRRAEQWTEKMRGLMESRDTSSGLKFSIKWRPRTAESEQELDTKDLVSLLKQDANLLTDNDLERITNHFRSKIQAAKVWMEEKGEGQTLLQVLKMVLDYRKWFSFVLYFERTNEPRRELTNHNFFKFSGGEKAMAMYIPLFTACYSRYQEAEPHAPYIISLDEAFAGVDENNINEMFEIVEQLGFNYIMNSQVLWGDYETVTSLSVCELVRPKNANYVTVIRYKWDGQALTVQLPEEVETT